MQKDTLLLSSHRVTAMPLNLVPNRAEHLEP